MADPAFDADMAARLLCEAVHHGESESGALANRLGRKEGVEHFDQDFRRHAGAGVGDRNGDVVAGVQAFVMARFGFAQRRMAGRQDQSTAMRHGIARIDGQVENGAFELRLVTQRSAYAVGQLHLEPHLLAQRAAQQVFHRADQCVDIDRARVERLAPRERQQTLNERGCTMRRLCCRTHVAIEVVGAAQRDAAPHDLDRAGDALQQVIEVVRDAAGELPDGFHLLALAQPRLGVAQRRDVAPDCMKRVRVGHRVP